MSETNSDSQSENIARRQYVEACSQQLLMDPDCEWGDLLSAAPRTLACLGQAFVAATSNAANASVQIERNGPLQYTSLRANLQHCADLGQEAFLEAEGRMKKLQLVAEIVNSPDGAIDKILRLCEHQSLARSDLPRQIDRMKKLSSDCVEDTAIVQRKFEDWAELAKAIRRGYTARIESQRLEGKGARQNARLDYQQERLASAKLRLEEDRRNLDHHARDMAKAQDKIPGGREAVRVRAADALMNGIGYAAQGAAAAFMAATKIAAAGGPTINLKMTTDANKPAATPRKKGRNTIKRARENYESSKKAFLESQQHYRELEAKDRKEKDRFNEIQLELQKLSQEDISIEKVKTILAKCIDNLTNFQENMTLLRRFFNDIHNRISVIDQTYVASFLDSAAQLAKNDEADKEELEERRTYYLEEIRHDAFTLRASYAVAGELSGTYVQISKKHILPGVTQVNRLMLTISRDNSGTTVAEKVKQINAYARKAQSEISAVATERRERIKDQLVDVGRNITDAGEKLDEYADAGYGDEDEIAGDEWDDIDAPVGNEETQDEAAAAE
ncbi:MAG: hypothetical protein LQ352_001906 [Teloschistes flavicans]|nr:MAG: hypothetical protein LQ352_001906 [Teloschistes flavicans]